MGNFLLSNQSFLILGGLGYFGSRLAEYLAKYNNVTVTCRSENSIRYSWANSKNIEVICTKGKGLGENLKSRNFDCLINLATPGSSECSKDTKKALEETQQNINDCFDGLRSGRFSRLVHFSSFHVYGKVQDIYTEMDQPHPVSPYGFVHFEAEKTLATFGADLPITVIRPSNMVGRPAHTELGDQARLLALDLCNQAIGGELTIHNDGKSYRDFVSIENAIAAVEYIIYSKSSPLKVCNLASGQSLMISDFVDFIVDYFSQNKKKLKVTYGNSTDLYRLPFKIDNSKLKELGWKPNHDLPFVINEIIRFFEGVKT